MVFPYFGELDNHRNKTLFGKRKEGESSPRPRSPNKSPKKTSEGSPSTSSPASSDTQPPSSNAAEVVQAAMDKIALERHPFKVPPSGLTRKVFHGKHPFMDLNLKKKFVEEEIEAVREVAATALGLAILCEDTREVMPNATEAQSKDPIHAFHQGLLQSIYGDVLMREGAKNEALKNSIPLEDSFHSTDGAFVVPEDSEDQLSKSERTDLNFYRKLKTRIVPRQGTPAERTVADTAQDDGGKGWTSSGLESLLKRERAREWMPLLSADKQKKMEVAVFTNEQKSDTVFGKFDSDEGVDGCSQASEYAVLKCARLCAEERTSQRQYGISCTSSSKFRLGEVDPAAIVVIPEDGDYSKLKVLPLADIKDGPRLLTELEEAVQVLYPGMTLEERYKEMASIASKEFHVQYKGRFLTGFVNWTRERLFLGTNPLEANPRNIYAYVFHFLKYVYGKRLPELTVARVKAARQAVVESAMTAASLLMHGEAVDGSREWTKEAYFEERMKAIELETQTAGKEGVADQAQVAPDALASARNLVKALLAKKSASFADLEQLQSLLEVKQEHESS